jgi:quercetin dioxygenase-like cupin family protein
VSADPSGLAVGAGEGETIRSPLGGDIVILVRGDQSDGALAALEAIARPGEGPPLHIHTREDETVYVLEGEFRWKLGDQLTGTTGPGSFVFIPQGLPHTWQCLGDQRGRMMITFAPAGMERFFELQAKQTVYDPEVFRAAAAEAAMDVVGPTLAESDPL